MILIPLSDLSIFSFITAWSLLPSVLRKLELGEGKLCAQLKILVLTKVRDLTGGAALSSVFPFVQAGQLS